MDSLMQNSAYFGFFITLMGYWCAVQVGKRMRSTLCNPLLLSIIFIIAFLKLTNISYDSCVYNGGNDRADFPSDWSKHKVCCQLSVLHG